MLNETVTLFHHVIYPLVEVSITLSPWPCGAFPGKPSRWVAPTHMHIVNNDSKTHTHVLPLTREDKCFSLSKIDCANIMKETIRSVQLQACGILYCYLGNQENHMKTIE